MKTRILILIVLPFVAGCSSFDGGEFVYKLPPNSWPPLEEIRQRPALVGHLGGSKSAITTIGTVVYTHDLAKWLEFHPPGSAIFESKMRHEQVHSSRQLLMGVTTYVARYTHDKKFALFEEQLGWYQEITHLKKRGLRPNPVGIAKILSSYRNLSGKLISYAEAKQWVLSVLNGNWKPPK